MKRSEAQRSDVSAGVPVTVVTVPPGDTELGADRLMSAGAFAVEERATPHGAVELRAVLGGTESESRRLLGELPPAWMLHVEHVDSEPLDTWREFAVPVRVTPDLVLRPAWL